VSDKLESKLFVITTYFVFCHELFFYSCPDYCNI